MGKKRFKAADADLIKDPTLGLKPGDIVTCYYAGFWKVEYLYPMVNYTPTASRYQNFGMCLTKIADTDFKPCSPKSEHCAVAWCQKVDHVFLINWMNEQESLRKRMDDFANQYVMRNPTPNEV